jgi:WD40 repeat protein
MFGPDCLNAFYELERSGIDWRSGDLLRKAADRRNPYLPLTTVAVVTISLAAVGLLWLAGGGGHLAQAGVSGDRYSILADITPNEAADHWSIIYRQPPTVTVAALGPDDFVAYTDNGGSLRVARQGEHQSNHVLLPSTGAVRLMDWHPDQPRLLTAAGRHLTLWDLAEVGQESARVLRLDAHDYEIASIGFSPDGQQIASLDKYGTLCLWGGNGGLMRQVVAFPGRRNAGASDDTRDEGYGNEVVWFPDASRLLTIGGGRGQWLRIWSRYGEKLDEYEWDGDRFGFGRAAFTDDGQRLATLGGLRGVFWNVSDRLSPIRSFEVNADVKSPGHIAWVNEAEILVASGVGWMTVPLEESESTSVTTPYAANAVAWRDDERVALSDAANREFRVANMKHNTTEFTAELPDVCSANAVARLGQQTFVAGDDNGSLFAIAANRSGILWHASSLDSVTTIAVSREGDRIVSGHSSGAVLEWMLNGQLDRELEPGDSTIGSELLSLAWSPDDQTLAGLNQDGQLSFWRKEAVGVLTPLPELSQSTSVSVDSRVGPRVCLPNSMTWISDTVVAICLKNLGGFQLVSIDGTVVHIPARGNNGELRTRDHVAVGVDPNCAVLAVGSAYGHLSFWRLDSLEAPFLFNESVHHLRIRHVEWMESIQSFITSGNDGLIARWGPDGRFLHYFPKPDQTPIRVLRCSPSGELLAAGDASGNVWIWNRFAKQIAMLKGHLGEVTAISWSQDSQSLAVCSRHGMSRVWNIQTLHSPGIVVSRPDGPTLVLRSAGESHFESASLRDMTLSYTEEEGEVSLTVVE